MPWMSSIFWKLMVPQMSSIFWKPNVPQISSVFWKPNEPQISSILYGILYGHTDVNKPCARGGNLVKLARSPYFAHAKLKFCHLSISGIKLFELEIV